MELLKKCYLDKLSKFLHSQIDHICGLESLDYNIFSNFWSLEEWFTICTEVKITFQDLIKSDCNNEQISKRFSNFNLSYQEIILEVLTLRKADLRNVSIEKSQEMGIPSLENFDWSVKLTLANDKLATLKQPIVNLDLQLKNNASSYLSIIEMDKRELKKLIESLEAAQKVLLEL